jgi:hypothetical protein
VINLANKIISCRPEEFAKTVANDHFVHDGYIPVFPKTMSTPSHRIFLILAR